jgi:hypothetical protein
VLWFTNPSCKSSTKPGVQPLWRKMPCFQGKYRLPAQATHGQPNQWLFSPASAPLFVHSLRESRRFPLFSLRQLFSALPKPISHCYFVLSRFSTLFTTRSRYASLDLSNFCSARLSIQAGLSFSLLFYWGLNRSYQFLIVLSLRFTADCCGCGGLASHFSVNCQRRRGVFF